MDEMDPLLAVPTRDEFWRLQADLKSLIDVQSEYSDRLLRLERRYEDDSRMKSVWGHSSSFPGALIGTPQQDNGYNPASEAFKTFDQDQSTGMLGSLHLDTDEEPRRGASRANSVRFDESALHGHFGHNSRSSSEFFPIRTTSAFGSHPMTERSSSHKSDGRHSSAGHSAHSTRLNSLAQDATRSVGNQLAIPSGPAPGLFLLGPLPCIIRCWLDTTFSNEKLIYCAICSGSYKSVISSRLLKKLDMLERTKESASGRCVRLKLYLPEGTVLQSSPHPGGPIPSLPAITVTFEIIELSSDMDSIDVILGSDVLRPKNADVLFSQNCLTLYDDERHKIEVPLVRPENEAMFRSLVTTSQPSMRSSHMSAIPGPFVEGGSSLEEAGRSITSSRNKDSGQAKKLPTDKPKGVTVITKLEDIPTQPSDTKLNARLHGEAEPEPSLDSQEPTSATTEYANSRSYHQSSRAVHGNTGSWRGNMTDSPQHSTFSSVASGSVHSPTTRGKGMKILKPSRIGSTRSTSATNISSASDVQTSALAQPYTYQQDGTDQPGSSRPLHSIHAMSKEHVKSMPPIENKPKTSPASSGLAFGWLSSSKNV